MQNLVSGFSGCKFTFQDFLLQADYELLYFGIGAELSDQVFGYDSPHPLFALPAALLVELGSGLSS